MKKTLYALACALCTLLVLPAAAQVPNYVPTDGLVGWWPFNGNANDESGNGNDGVVNGATLTEDRFGNANAAYSFDGLDDFIEVLNSTELALDGNEFTVSVWYTLNSAPPAENRNMLCKSSGAGPFDKWIIMKTLGEPFYPEGEGIITYPPLNAPSFNGFISTSGPTSLGIWNHLLIIRHESALSIYSNGLLEYSTEISGTILPNDANLRIGGDEINSVDNNKFWSGLLDDIGIWNRALTEQEIQNLYTGQCPSVSTNCTSLPSNLQQGLVGYWPFCGNANDESGNGNDGVVNGATLTEDRFGNINSAYFFEGGPNADADGIQMSNPIIENTEFTICYWMQAEFFNDSRHITIDGTNNYAFEFMAHSDTSIFFRNWDGQINNPILDFVVEFEESLSDLNNFCFTYDQQTLKFLINGSVDSTIQFENLNIPVGGAITIGKHPYFPNSAYTAHIGSLDDIGIWNRALTPEEVQELYTLDACTFTVYDTLTVYETVHDTLYTYETIYDTVTTHVTVTDTLLIDITFVGFEGQPSWLNTVTVFPNPASDHITIDYGNFALMEGYNTIITDAAGATVYSSAVNSQQVEIDINAWGATGVYYMSVYDASGALVAVRHIVLE